MISKPFFTIIIPTLNEAKYLPKLLSDLSAQTFSNFEVIIVDGNSTDKTVELAKDFGSQLKLNILTSPRRHVCTQRNLGAAHASSDILIFSDADNRLPPYFLQGLKYRWESNDANLISFWLKPDISTRQNETTALAINTFFEMQNNLKPTFLLESLFSIQKQCFVEVGGFDESIGYAEGKSLIQSVNKLGYKSMSVRDPSYTFSFRRFRKYGIMGVIGKVAIMELSELLGSEFHSLQAKKLYPMVGGALFTKPKKIKNKFIKNISKLLKDF